MRRKLTVLFGLLLLLLFGGALGYGLYQGDAKQVARNAAAFCFT